VSAYIDGVACVEAAGEMGKSGETRRYPKDLDVIPQRAVGCPSVAGGGGWQSGGSMRAVSGAPLTVTTYTKDSIDSDILSL
jgi:hypothetical protein